MVTATSPECWNIVGVVFICYAVRLAGIKSDSGRYDSYWSSPRKKPRKQSL